jgi:hypothetical protein
MNDSLNLQNTSDFNNLSHLSVDKVAVGCRLRSKITGVEGTVVEFNKNVLVDGVLTTVPIARVLWDNGKQNTIDLRRYVSAWFINDTINHKLIIDELIKSVKLQQRRKLWHGGMSKEFIIQEFHTVGLKLTCQVGLTTYVRSQITKGSKACVLVNQAAYVIGSYNKTTENVFNIDQHSIDEIDTELTIFFVEQCAVPSEDKCRLYNYLYQLAGEELVIVELYS